MGEENETPELTEHTSRSQIFSSMPKVLVQELTLMIHFNSEARLVIVTNIILFAL